MSIPPSKILSQAKCGQFIRSISLLIALFSFAGAMGQNGLLYKLEHPDLHDAYLYGTIHIMPEHMFKMDSTVLRAFHDMDALALELDMDNPLVLVETLAGLMMAGDTTLSMITTPDEYAKLDSALRASGQSISMLERFKPTLILPMLLGDFTQGEDLAGYDMFFLEQAKKDRVEVLGLESASDQMEALDFQSYREQIVEVLDFINGGDESMDEVDNLLQAYLDEDLQAIDSMMLMQYGGDERALEQLLYRRNEKWVPRIFDILEDQSTFIAVGAGHLPGDRGLLELLSRNGFKVLGINR